MRVAVPLFGQDVAPRFGYADHFLIVNVDDYQIVGEDDVKLEFAGWPHRLGQLRDLGVGIILCGGFNRWFVPLAEDLGINVLSGLCGNARSAVEAFVRGETMPTFPCNGKGKGRRGGPGCNRNRKRVRGGGRSNQ